MTENVFTNAFNGMADSIANFAVTGKGSFRSLTVSILADLAKMEARIAASKLLGSVLGMFVFGASAGGSTPSGAYSSAALSVIQMRTAACTAQQDSVSTAAVLLTDRRSLHLPEGRQ